MLCYRSNNSGENNKDDHSSDRNESKPDEGTTDNDHASVGQASNPNKAEIPDRGSRRIRGGARVSCLSILLKYGVLAY